MAHHLKILDLKMKITFLVITTYAGGMLRGEDQFWIMMKICQVGKN